MQTLFVFSLEKTAAQVTDRALRGLASIRPRSLAEAEGIPGIGPVKLHAVVPRFLEALAKWEKNGD